MIIISSEIEADKKWSEYKEENHREDIQTLKLLLGRLKTVLKYLQLEGVSLETLIVLSCGVDIETLC